jgi:hypothetical protein
MRTGDNGGSNPAHREQHSDPIIEATRRWVDRAIVGLNLCPFAGAVHRTNRIWYAISQAHDEESLLGDLRHELTALADTPAENRETTLLIHPYVLTDFLDYNEFLGRADDLLREMNLVGKFQIASFHPDYRFHGTGADDIGNFTNRSPYPLLHLLREDSVEWAVETGPNVDEILEANQKTMTKLGRAGWDALWNGRG